MNIENTFDASDYGIQSKSSIVGDTIVINEEERVKFVLVFEASALKEESVSLEIEKISYGPNIASFEPSHELFLDGFEYTLFRSVINLVDGNPAMHAIMIDAPLYNFIIRDKQYRRIDYIASIANLKGAPFKFSFYVIQGGCFSVDTDEYLEYRCDRELTTINQVVFGDESTVKESEYLSNEKIGRVSFSGTPRTLIDEVGCFNTLPSPTEVVLPLTITEIGDGVFSTSSLKFIDARNVISIGNESFKDCKIKEITTIDSWDQKESDVAILSDDMTTMGYRCFSSCGELKKAKIPASVTEIPDGAFYKCTSLSSITMHNGITNIGANAFEFCTSLSDFEIPSGVTAISEYAFMGCLFKDLQVPDSVEVIGAHAFDLVPSIIYDGEATGSTWGALAVNGFFEGDVIYSDETKSKLASYDKEAEGDVIIDENVTEIGRYAFYNCSKLSSITIHTGITSIGDGAFYLTKDGIAITLKSTTPPVVDGSLFNHMTVNNTRIYVPTSALVSYKQANGWKEYKDKMVGY